MSAVMFRTSDGYTFYRVPKDTSFVWVDSLDPDRVDMTFDDVDGKPVDILKEKLEGGLKEIMGPKELILNGIYMACDNGHDMGIKDSVLEDDHIALNQYAVISIVEDICEGKSDDFPECAYLEQYDDDDVPIKHSIGALRAVLVEALVEFYADERSHKCGQQKTIEALKESSKTNMKVN